MIKINKDFSEVLKKGSSALLIRIAGFVAGYLFIFYTVKLFGAETQGRLNLSFSFMMIGALICRLGLDIHFVKIYSIPGNFHNSKGIYYKVIPYVLALTLLISGCIFLFSEHISNYIFNDPELSIFLKWVSPCVIFFTFILLNASVFRGLKKNSLYAFLFNGGRYIFTLIIFLGLVIFYNNPIITIIAHTLAILILFLISLRYIFKYNFPFGRTSTYTTKRFVQQSLPMLVSTSMIVFLGWSDTIVLGIYKNSSDVGIYSVVLKISVVTSFTFQALDSILAPKLSNAYHAKEMTLFKKLVKFSTILNSIISILVVIAIIFFKDLILAVFGDEFFKASTALIILCIGQLFNAICGPVGSILQMTGRQVVFRNILMLAFLINILLNFLLAPSYGINGVAVATALSLAFWNLSSVIYISKKIY